MREENKRIARNTMILYFRMMLSMFITLYTSRVVLDVLGVVDYGIQNVVGGIIGMVGFLNASMSGATSRFITFEIGTGDSKKINYVFSTAVTVHLLIAVIIVALGATLGFWFLENELVIPNDRMVAARVIYIFTLVSTFLSITQVPYTAMLFAYERMDIYAKIEILNTVLRLVYVFAITKINNYDMLILNGLFLLLISSINIFIYKIVCIRSIPESRYKFRWKWNELKPMLTYSSWDLYGNLSVMARTQGINILMNVFFGPIINAANGISTQVQNAVMSFASNILGAFRPQIVKSYAQENYNRTSDLVINASKICFVLLLLVSLPLIIEMPYILSLWLKEVPEYTIIFCRLTLIFNFLANMSSVVISAIHATGKIKRPSVINGTLYLSVVPISYILYKLGYSPWISYVINILMVTIGMLSNVYTLKLYMPSFGFWKFVKEAIYPCIILLIFSCLILFPINKIVINQLYKLIVMTVTSTVSIAVVSYLIILNKEQRTSIKLKLSNYPICKKIF